LLTTSNFFTHKNIRLHTPASRNKDMPICVLSLENSKVLKNANGFVVVRCTSGSILVYSTSCFFQGDLPTAFQCLLPVSQTLMIFTTMWRCVCIWQLARLEEKNGFLSGGELLLLY